MAKLKMMKMPKAPKATASVEAKQGYLKRLAEVKKENRRREAINKKSDMLSAKIAKARASFRK
ncbi:MAG: hypothetical protein KBS70_03485 [Bacteroidales bacterium]|nr:hypothetical protein [Candidatus Colicola equi]